MTPCREVVRSGKTSNGEPASPSTRGRRARNGKHPPQLIGSDARLTELRSTIATVCNRHCIVLIHGESGTGKELVARHIHAAGQRAAGPFITVDCTTLRDTLLESQLFGHVKGSFTGAEHSTLGLFRAADGGTLFLDEIGELAPPVQSKLLRCIQESAVVPLGAVDPIHVDVRIIAATHRDLQEMVRQGTFREDLYYRLNVVRLCTPPLRSRVEDIAPLAERFLAQQAELYAEPTKRLSAAAQAALQVYSWPGNVRELGNVIEHVHVFTAGERVQLDDLPGGLREVAKNRCRNGRIANGASRVVPLAVVERCMIQRALRATNGNQTRAAELLGLERHRLGRLIRRHGLPRTENRPRLQRSIEQSVVQAASA